MLVYYNCGKITIKLKHNSAWGDFVSTESLQQKKKQENVWKTSDWFLRKFHAQLLTGNFVLLSTDTQKDEWKNVLLKSTFYKREEEKVTIGN